MSTIKKAGDMDEQTLSNWKGDFNTRIERAVDRPLTEIFTEGLNFCDWRISYGVSAKEPETVYFLSFYPAFCLSPKATYHYSDLDKMASDVDILENFVPINKGDNSVVIGVKQHDLIATAFAILRNKESIELFQDQKDLMGLGLKHYHLDNYYQDAIRGICIEYADTKTIFGKPFSLSILPECSEDANG